MEFPELISCLFFCFFSQPCNWMSIIALFPCSMAGVCVSKRMSSRSGNLNPDHELQLTAYFDYIQEPRPVTSVTSPTAIEHHLEFFLLPTSHPSHPSHPGFCLSRFKNDLGNPSNLDTRYGSTFWVQKT